MSPIDTLLGAIFEDRRPGFYTEFEAWVRGSRLVPCVSRNVPDKGSFEAAGRA
ncbi:MAG: hypothetical protein IPM16_15300 [Chloroflexi bacterium]|nr:hypothetical protein [Chloroflexota bacterium]